MLSNRGCSVTPVLICGGKLWVMNKKRKTHIQAIDMIFHRGALGMTRFERSEMRK